MWMDSYARASRALAQELIEAMSEEDLAILRGALAGVTVRDWDRWRLANADAVAGFVSATPAERDRRKGWNRTPVARLQLALAATQHCLQAQAILRAIAADGLAPGLSNRQMAALAGESWWRAVEAEIPDWPFPGDSPFAS